MSNLVYPKDLDTDIQPYMLFSAYSWSMKGKKTQNPRSIRSSVDSVQLPLPINGIVDTFSHNWEEASTIGSENYMQALIKNIAGKAVDIAGDFGKYISAKKGFIINDYASLAYNGTGFRVFDFSFELAAKNESESNTIQNIIKSFKRNSLPSYQNWKITYPNFWNISVIFPGRSDTIKIKDCVLTNISVNHFPDNTFSIFKNGAPIKPEITLNFKELAKTDRNEFI